MIRNVDIAECSYFIESHCFKVTIIRKPSKIDISFYQVNQIKKEYTHIIFHFIFDTLFIL